MPETQNQKTKWTQEKDEILINNYKSFENLGTKGCFELLAALIPEMTANECYKRGKQLKLKKMTAEESKAISKSLLSDHQSNLNERKVEIAL